MSTADATEALRQLPFAVHANRGAARRHDAGRDLGYVETLPNPGHRRSVLIATTAAGRGAFEAVHEREMAVLHRVAGSVADEDAAACLRVVSHLTEAFRARTESDQR